MPALLEVLVHCDSYSAVVRIVRSHLSLLKCRRQIGRPRVDYAAEDVARSAE